MPLLPCIRGRRLIIVKTQLVFLAAFIDLQKVKTKLASKVFFLSLRKLILQILTSSVVIVGELFATLSEFLKFGQSAHFFARRCI